MSLFPSFNTNTKRELIGLIKKYKKEDLILKDISEKVSYLQGLSEGLNVSDGSPQGKIIAGILAVLEDINGEIINIKSNFEDFKEYVESIDDDLFDLEENLNRDDDSDYTEVKCASCGEKLYFSSEVMDDDDVIEIICPNCNEVVFINDGSFDYAPAYIQDQENDNNYSEAQKPSPS